MPPCGIGGLQPCEEVPARRILQPIVRCPDFAAGGVERGVRRLGRLRAAGIVYQIGVAARTGHGIAHLDLAWGRASREALGRDPRAGVLRHEDQLVVIVEWRANCTAGCLGEDVASLGISRVHLERDRHQPVWAGDVEAVVGGVAVADLREGRRPDHDRVVRSRDRERPGGAARGTWTRHRDDERQKRRA
jgi:hypothetical protein